MRPFLGTVSPGENEMGLEKFKAWISDRNSYLMSSTHGTEGEERRTVGKVFGNYFLVPKQKDKQQKEKLVKQDFTKLTKFYAAKGTINRVRR